MCSIPKYRGKTFATHASTIKTFSAQQWNHIGKAVTLYEQRQEEKQQQQLMRELAQNIQDLLE